MMKTVFLMVTAVFCGCVLAEESGGQTKQPDPDRKVMLAARKAHDDKDYEKAVSLWKQLEKKIDSNFREIAVFGIGEALKEQKKYDEAIKQFDKLFVPSENESDSDINLIPNNREKADGKIQTAVCYMYKGKYKKALKALKFADHVYPYRSWCGTCQISRAAVIPTYQGMCYENLKNYDVALHYYFNVVFDEFAFNAAVEFRIFDLYHSQGQLDSLKKILDQAEKKRIEKQTAKNGPESVDKESFNKHMPTDRIRFYMKNPQISIKKRNQSFLNNFRGVYFPTLPKKIKLPESLAEVGGGNAKQETTEIDMAEMILLLERAEIIGVSVYHSQNIHIRLKDGSSFTGKYIHAQAGKYSDDKELSDGYNLVMKIRKKRRSEDVKDWIIKRE